MGRAMGRAIRLGVSAQSCGSTSTRSKVGGEGDDETAFEAEVEAPIEPDKGERDEIILGVASVASKHLETKKSMPTMAVGGGGSQV